MANRKIDMNRPAVRPVTFFAPADGRGKWHASFKVTGQPYCGAAAVTLSDEQRIVATVGSTLHPIVCKKCGKVALWQGYSTQGLKG